MDENDDREAVSRARSAQNLEPYSAEELADQQARRTRNAIERIMHPPAPAPAEPPAIVRKTRDDGLTPAAEAAIRLRELDAKAEVGLLTADELRVRWVTWAMALTDEARRSPAAGFEKLAVNVAALWLAIAKRNKPRVRVAAGRRVL